MFVLVAKFVFDKPYPSLHVYVQILPNWFVFVHMIFPFVGAVLEGSHVIAVKKFDIHFVLMKL